MVAQTIERSKNLKHLPCTKIRIEVNYLGGIIVKTKTKLSILFLIISTALIFNFSIISNVKATSSIPNLQLITQPLKIYEQNQVISLKVNSPGYSGKVEYRAILFDTMTEQSINLWNYPSSGYYNISQQSIGSNAYEIKWPVNQIDPGIYNITVLVRRVGTKSSYDSYVKTNNFFMRTNITNNPLSVFFQSDKFGYKDSNGKVVIKPKYKYATSFNGGLASVMDSGDHIYYIDINGIPVINPQNNSYETLQYSSESYRGYVNPSSKYKEGLGTYTWSYGNTYVGHWLNNKISGVGVLKYSNGDVYLGAFTNGVKSGYGQYIFNSWKGKEQYIGYWSNDTMNGYGVYYFANGDKYQGNWVNGYMSGTGTYIYSNGKVQNGTWSYGIFNG